MPRFKIVVEFDGTNYAGWQQQRTDVASIQEALQDAIKQYCGQEAVVHGAGRTDAGVHAAGMVAHVDLAAPVDANNLRKAVNAKLRPQPIGILTAEQVADDFEARFHCLERRYLYRVISRRAPLALMRGRAWQVYTKVELQPMQACASMLIGKHDFSTFRAVSCQAASPVKTLDVLEVTQVEAALGPEIQIRARARSFLHHQVRNIVGSLLEVGLGRWTEQEFETAFRARNRCAGGPTAPAHGLYFMEAVYSQ